MAKKSKRPRPKVKQPVKNTVKKASTPIAGKPFWRNYWMPALILFIIPFILYASSLSFEYVLDDKIVITDNQYTKKGFAGIREIFTTESFQGYFGEQRDLLVGGRYRPLSIATFAIEYEFFGLNPKVGHFINILLYALTGVLLFRILCMLIPPLKNVRWWLALPFVAALLYILHPIHTEVVANVKGRDEILSFMGALGALYFSFLYLRKRNYLMLALASISFFLGLMAKENALTWVAVIPLTAWFFRKDSFKQILFLTIPLILVSIIYLIIRTKVIGYFLSSGTEVTDIMNNPFYGLSTGEKFATIFYTLGMYLKLLLFPHPLTHDYYPYQIPVLTFSDFRAIGSLLINVALGVWALWGLKKKSIISYGILFYFITLSIVSNIPFTVGATMNERFVYASSLGICLIIAYFFTRKLPELLQTKKDEINYLSVGLLGLVLIGYATKTFLRVPDWRNALTLNRAAIKYSPNSARANCFMGVALFEDYKIETDQARRYALLDELAPYIEKALEIHPNYGSALTMQSGVAAEQYKRDKDLDKLLRKFEVVLKTRPQVDFVNTYIEYLLHREDVSKLAQFLYDIGYHFNAQQKGDFNTALHYLNYAYEIAPGDALLNLAIAKCYQGLGNQEKAQQFFNVAYTLDPSLQQ